MNFSIVTDGLLGYGLPLGGLAQGAVIPAPSVIHFYVDPQLATEITRYAASPEFPGVIDAGNAWESQDFVDPSQAWESRTYFDPRKATPLK